MKVKKSYEEYQNHLEEMISQWIENVYVDDIFSACHGDDNFYICVFMMPIGEGFETKEQAIEFKDKHLIPRLREMEYSEEEKINAS